MINKFEYEIKNNNIKCVNNIEKYIKNAKINEHNTLISINENALNEAKNVDVKINNKSNGNLAGIPIVLEDSIVTKNLLTTCGSKMLYNFVPPYQSTLVEKLKKADAILIGKANMDEFGVGENTDNSNLGQVINPINANLSVGNNACAVSLVDEIAEVAIGGDTDGNFRESASFMAKPVLLPTFGLVSRFGIIGATSGFDQFGIVANKVKDLALMLNTIAGFDPKDSVSEESKNIDYLNYNNDIKGLKIGVVKEFKDIVVDEKINKTLGNTIELLNQQGAEIVEISLPLTKYSVGAHYVQMAAEVTSNLARLDGIKYGYRSKDVKNLEDIYVNSRSEAFCMDVKKLIMAGNFVVAGEQFESYYIKSRQIIKKIRTDIDKAFKNCDAIISPISVKPSRTKNEKKNINDNIFAIQSNLSGCPVVALNCNKADNISLQFMANRFDEEKLFTIANVIEKLVK